MSKLKETGMLKLVNEKVSTVTMILAYELTFIIHDTRHILKNEPGTKPRLFKRFIFFFYNFDATCQLSILWKERDIYMHESIEQIWREIMALSLLSSHLFHLLSFQNRPFQTHTAVSHSQKRQLKIQELLN